MHRLIFTTLVLLSLSACSVIPSISPSDAADPSTLIQTPTQVEVVPPGSPIASITVSPVETPLDIEPAETPSPPIPLTEAPIEDTPSLAPLELAGRPPIRDDIRLATAYRGADPMATPAAPLAGYEIGAVESFFVGNVDDNTMSAITAELLSIGDHAYFWFDTGEGGVSPDAELLNEGTAAFDEIFTTLYDYFGSAAIDGERAHIVHASPLALCAEAERCRLAGYFSPQDLLPKSVNPTSNERPMFVMNAWQFETPSYLDTLAHELRHMLGAEYDAGEEDWFVEGAAMLAEELAGFGDIPQARGNLFLTNPDQQLNSWTDGNTIPHYGQGYLVNRFLFDRLGTDLYREYTLNPTPGLAAVDEIAAANGLSFTGESLWLDWLVSMALIDEAGSYRDNRIIPDRYRWLGPDLTPAVATSVDSLPAEFETTVAQYGADYYQLPSSGNVAIDFIGADAVSLLGTRPPSGENMWYARRANYSNPRLTRSLDLRDVSSATLQYKFYSDIEAGYDFAYVAVSTDGGVTWEPLEASGMQGLDPADDPSGSAFTERFYTGRRQAWISESIDLSPYAGQEILLRFEYVTDPILTYGGFALDDITVPEIGFVDDAEGFIEGWVAEGFVRTAAELEQNWHLQLVTFDQDGRPTVELLPVSPDGRIQHNYQSFPGARRPILIVAATAPETLETVAYALNLK